MSAGAPLSEFLDGERGRVPFALVGVLLLVTSSAFAASLDGPAPVRNDDVETAMERVDAESVTALRVAADDAAVDAAANPVTARAETPAGSVLNESSPFVDSLRIRLYLAARERFERTTYHRNDVAATVSLPAVRNVSDLRLAKRSVTVERVDEGTAMRVTLENVTRTATRDGRVVATRTDSLTVTVANPVLLAHDRTESFESRLGRSALSGPGLDRRLTARLYAVAWARGYAQNRGAPIENVVSNRHVGLSTNTGVVAVQRAAFGRSDPAARRGVERATIRVGASDLLAPAPPEAGDAANAILAPPNGPTSSEPSTSIPTVSRDERSLTVGVNRTADAAFVSFLDEESTDAGGDGADERSLSETLVAAYRVDAQLSTRVEQTHDEAPRRPSSPGRNWSRLGDESRTDVSVVAGDAALPSPAGTRTETATRQVVERHVRTVTWQRGDETRTTRAVWTDRYRVGIALGVEQRALDGVPSRPVDRAFERGGALSGPNLADTPTRAWTKLVDRRGGVDAVARHAVERAGPSSAGNAARETRTTRVVGDRPERLGSWVYDDISAFRTEVRAIHVELDATDVASGEANPPAELAAELRSRRATLLDAPETYDGAADRARVAARAAYLERVLDHLDARADRTAGRNERLSETLADHGASATSSAELSRLVETAEEAVVPDPRTFGERRPGRDVALYPDGSPAYLTLGSVDRTHAPTVPANASYRPLAARNTNLVTAPYGDVADTIVGGALKGSKETSLRTGGQVLVVANLTADATENRTLDERRKRLRTEVAGGVDVTERAARTTLESETELSPAERRAAVDDGFGEWDGHGHRALAAVNGSAATAIADRVGVRRDWSDRRTDRLELRLRTSMLAAARSDAARVDRQPTQKTSMATQWLAQRAKKRLEAELENGTKRAADHLGKRVEKRLEGTKWADKALVGVPSGLPVAPVPGYWYATVNVWTVEARGEYAQFVVTARRGPAGTSDLRYVRDGSTVTLDVDGDGEAERLGRSERISFEVQTTVVVAVPPTPPGVGDVDGDADERSGGWPTPGCTPKRRC
ncbi:DUF7286 family protein [Haloprofundus marisrubri]|uniref:DUF7286 family protein n=1 Tax=Haloprofundus marisrubri TaxID=1514971 RepID=UPI0008F808FB|nr:hypothetical protein [Haloprofundus marisrubri]